MGVRWDRLPLRSVSQLVDGPALVRGTVVQLEGAPVEPPYALPPGAAPVERIAAALVDVEETPFLARPRRVTHECLRAFWLRDATGRALVRFLAADRPELELRLHRPFVEGAAGSLALYARAVALGDEVVVAGRVSFRVDPSGGGLPTGTYREAPRAAVVDALRLWDAEAWEGLEAWRVLPWHRKLALLVWNR